MQSSVAAAGHVCSAAGLTQSHQAADIMRLSLSHCHRSMRLLHVAGWHASCSDAHHAHPRDLPARVPMRLLLVLVCPACQLNASCSDTRRVRRLRSLLWFTYLPLIPPFALRCNTCHPPPARPRAASRRTRCATTCGSASSRARPTPRSPPPWSSRRAPWSSTRSQTCEDHESVLAQGLRALPAIAGSAWINPSSKSLTPIMALLFSLSRARVANYSPADPRDSGLFLVALSGTAEGLEQVLRAWSGTAGSARALRTRA
jgi:hypothetical protein